MPAIDTAAAARDRVPDPPLSRWSFVAATAAACLVFTAFSATFLYFFVDDEAIPLIYARNLLRGRGLVYTALEGRVEGYSDFLHVLWSAVLLAAGRFLGQSHLFPMMAGKAVSFSAGVAILIVTAQALRRSGVTLAGLVAGLGFLALAGPLAVWSCSSLESTPFALLVAGFGFSLLVDPLDRGPRRWMSVALGTAVVLERIDGLLFVAAVMFAAWAAEPRRQKDLSLVAWPIAAASVAYHGWRYVYFGSLLSAPLMAKVFYRLAEAGQAMTKSAEVPYLLAFLRQYGLAAAPAIAVAAVLSLRAPAGRLATIALLLLGIYVGVVEDWMFGWRFVVPLLPFLAIVIGVAVGRAPPSIAWSAALLVVLWSGVAARRFVSAYTNGERRPVFWSQMHGGERAWLAPYYDLVVAARPLIRPGDRLAYNQAGLVPYLLDAENIDDLGICSRFIAGLPTRDVYFTGVGRYSPLTNQPVLRTAHAYLMYRDVKFLIGRSDLLLKANQNHVPDVLLDGLFSKVAMDASGENAIYQRTEKPADGYRRDPSLFTENLVHTTMLRRASIDGRALAPAAFGPELPFLRELTGSFSRDVEIDLGFGTEDADVTGFYIGWLASRGSGTVTLSLADASGRVTVHRALPFPAGGAPIFERFEAPARGRLVSIRLVTATGDGVTITDLRLEGQSAALGAYVHRRLTFPR
jgi:hypothetical protein